jgi:hypothetical protein
MSGQRQSLRLAGKVPTKVQSIPRSRKAPRAPSPDGGPTDIDVGEVSLIDVGEVLLPAVGGMVASSGANRPVAPCGECDIRFAASNTADTPEEVSANADDASGATATTEPAEGAQDCVWQTVLRIAGHHSRVNTEPVASSTPAAGLMNCFTQLDDCDTGTSKDATPADGSGSDDDTAPTAPRTDKGKDLDVHNWDSINLMDAAPKAPHLWSDGNNSEDERFYAEQSAATAAFEVYRDTNRVMLDELDQARAEWQKLQEQRDRDLARAAKVARKATAAFKRKREDKTWRLMRQMRNGSLSQACCSRSTEPVMSASVFAPGFPAALRLRTQVAGTSYLKRAFLR